MLPLVSSPPAAIFILAGPYNVNETGMNRCSNELLLKMPDINILQHFSPTEKFPKPARAQFNTGIVHSYLSLPRQLLLHSHL